MTNSNLKLNNEETSNADVNLNKVEPVINTGANLEELKSVTNENSQTEGFVNFDANIDTENIINSFYINDDEFDFYKDDTFDPSKAAFNSLNIDFIGATVDSNVIPVSDEMLKYLGFVNLFDKFKNDKTPIKLPSDRIEANKLFKQETGYTFQAFLNNDIPKKVVETVEFQKGLDNMYKFYQDKGFTVEVPERTNLTKFEQTLKGLGIEIGGGIGLDYITAPLLAAGPWGKLAYGAINFLGGGYLNYLSQEARLGQTGFLGQKDKFSWGEFFGAGGTQTIPFGVTAKGTEGVIKSFAFGATLGSGETTVRNLIDDKEFPTFKEYLLSIGLGGTFAATFKGGLELFDGLITKFKGKSPKEISNLITDKEVKKLNQFVDDSLTLQKQLQQQPQGKGKGKGNKNNQNQDLGDPNLTPNQYTNKVAKSENFGLIEELIRLKKLKNEGGTSPIKTQYQMQLGGLNLFDDGIIDLSKTKHIQEITKIYALVNDIAPTEDLAVALTQTVALATDGVVDANIKYVNALNSKDFNEIEKTINDLDLAFNEVSKWLGLSLPGRTTFGRTGQALQIDAPSGIAGKTVEEVMNMSPAQKRIAAESVGETTISLDKKIDAISDLKTELNKALEKAKKTGDFTDLYKVANKIKQTNGNVEKIVALEKHQILPSLLNKGARVINEIGINALMSAPGTNEVNLISGLLNTYLNAFKLALGARDKDGAEAALRHFMALHQNFMFASKSWKRSWDMEDNFINMGNSKVAFNPEDRFQISTTNKDWASRIAFNWTGKGIRLPSRLMTSNDALIQAPNLMAYSTMKFFLHGKNKLGLKGDELNKYINDSTNTIIEYFLSNGKAEIEDKVIQRILKESQEFSKSITFTNDIRTDSLFGMGANQVDKWAKNPIARLYLTFVRTPSNLIADGFKITPGIGTPLPTNTDNKLLNLGGEIVNFATLNKFLADEVRVDLLSKDPLIAQRARGGMNLAQGFGLTIAGMSFYYGNKFLEEDYVPDTILTGGGPDWTTKEGKAMWINMSKNGWQPYSVGKLQYNEDGSPKFINGEPVYTYSSYDNIGFDPVAQVVGMMVDFVNSNGFIKGKPFDDFTVGWTGVVGRNIFNKSYTKQVNEFLQFAASAPGLVDETGENPLKNYKLDKSKQFLADQTVSRLLPYSNLLSRFKTIPSDILEILGGYSREEMLNDENLSRFIQKRDTKVRPGDLIDEDVPIENESFNDKQLLKELWAYLKIAIHKKTPGYNANLPFMREHITNEPIVHPYKKGPDLFALRKHSTSKNYKIYLALAQIGRQLPEPKDVISAGYSNNNIEGKKLNTTEYALLREYINTHIPQGKKYGEVNLLQAINNYLDSEGYKAASKIIKQEGLTSEKGDILAKEIYSNLYSINNYYIKSGEAEFFTQVMGEEEILKRLEKKGKIKLELNNQIEKELSY